jgi:HPt (histidine-containing phosphotransfer) domain-containing protein
VIASGCKKRRWHSWQKIICKNQTYFHATPMLTQSPTPLAPAASDLLHAGGSAPDSKSPAVLDAQALDRLRALDPSGTSKLLMRVVQAFDASVARLLPQLIEALPTLEPHAIRHVSHTLKSSSATIGATKLSKLCAEVESMVRQDQTLGLAELIQQLIMEVGVAQAALQRVPIT